MKPEAKTTPPERWSKPILDKDKVLASIFRISGLLTTPSRIDEILEKILDEVVGTIGFDRGIIRLFDETRQFLNVKVVRNYTPEERERVFSIPLNIREDDCLAVKAATSGELLTIEDVSSDDRVTELDRRLTKIMGEGSIFVAPLKIDQDVIGILAGFSREQVAFFPEEIRLFQTYASQVSIIIHATRLLETNAEKIRQLVVLEEAVSEMNESHTLDHRIMDIMIESGLNIGAAERVLVYFLDVAKERCLINDGETVFIHDQATCDEKIGKGLIRRALEANTVLVSEAVGDMTETKPLEEEYPSEIAIPFNIRDKFRGALYLAKRSGGFTQDQKNLLDILVKNAATTYDNAIMHSILSLEAKTLKSEVEKLRENQEILLGYHNIIGKSEQMIDIFHMIEDIAGHDTNILVQGESGTGKELIARAIHRQSNRKGKPFVDVNCAAIPGTLLESELFGYEAGAFTDARRRKIGLLESAQGGTMLLDEIGEMSFPLQAKFLRMLEDRHIRRLGGTDNIPLDVRFVFATNRDLSRMVAEGLFREDLFYRISVVPVVLPPLRERKADILLLARYYVEEFNRKFRRRVRGFAKDAQEILLKYSWPGNVRELRNIIERIMILQNIGTMITAENLPLEIKAATRAEAEAVPLDSLFSLLPPEGIDYDAVTERIASEIKGKIITRALEQTGGNRAKAANLIGISRYKLIREEKKILRQTKPS
jgi:transcriptional regulator with GAF, ATPase, and Fis domain